MTRLGKALEPYRLFFLEDPFPPEDNDHFRLLRQQTSIPIAMGELFNTQHEYLPLIRRQDVKGFINKKPLWLVRPLGLDEVRKYAEGMEYEAARFYRRAAETTRDASTRQLLVELAEIEDKHEGLAQQLGPALLGEVRVADARARLHGFLDRLLEALDVARLEVDVGEADAAEALRGRDADIADQRVGGLRRHAEGAREVGAEIGHGEVDRRQDERRDAEGSLGAG